MSKSNKDKHYLFSKPLDKQIPIVYTTGMDVKMVQFKCLRCGHQWFPRKQETPLCCAKCKSPYWRRERSEKKRKNN